MILHWPALAGAVVLLWFPVSFLLGRERKRHLSQWAREEFAVVPGFLAWQNWVDLVRGYAGCFLLFAYALEAPEAADWHLWGWHLTILLGAVLMQTVRRYRKRTYFLAPVFFIWGIAGCLVGPVVALYGIVAGGGVARVAENLAWKFPVMAVVIGGAGFVFLGLTPQLLACLLVIVSPLLIAFCGRGNLVFLKAEKPRR